MLRRETCLFGGTRPKPSQDSVPASLTLAGDFSAAKMHGVDAFAISRCFKIPMPLVLSYLFETKLPSPWKLTQSKEKSPLAYSSQG